MDTPRAYRRARLAAMKAKARRIYPHDPKARLANHLASCSCWMCGNPRKWSREDSLAERRARAKDMDAINDHLDGHDR